MSLSSLTRALRRAILGRSGADYMLAITGGDSEYWDRSIAGQRGWPTTRAAASTASTPQVRSEKTPRFPAGGHRP